MKRFAIAFVISMEPLTDNIIRDESGNITYMKDGKEVFRVRPGQIVTFGTELHICLEDGETMEEAYSKVKKLTGHTITEMTGIEITS